MTKCEVDDFYRNVEVLRREIVEELDERKVEQKSKILNAIYTEFYIQAWHKINELNGEK